jgi:hypothetical protein
MKKIMAVLIVSAMFLISIQTARAAEATVAGNSARLENKALGLPEADARVEKLENYLASFNSPLAEYAATFVAEADKNGIDWKLVPAITGVESTFGKHIPYNSYNAYGWANGEGRFGSWEESIAHVSKFLKEKYYNRGLDTPAKIAPVYAPPSKTWGGNVALFMKRLDNFEVNTPELLELTF